MLICFGDKGTLPFHLHVIGGEAALKRSCRPCWRRRLNSRDPGRWWVLSMPGNAPIMRSKVGTMQYLSVCNPLFVDGNSRNPWIVLKPFPRTQTITNFYVWTSNSFAKRLSNTKCSDLGMEDCAPLKPSHLNSPCAHCFSCLSKNPH